MSTQPGLQDLMEGADLSATSRESRLTGLIAHLMLGCHDLYLRRYVMNILRTEFGCVSLAYGLAADDSPSMSDRCDT